MSKKQDPAADLQAGVVEVEAETEKLCGHVNKHYINTDGQLEDAACTLSKGHAGDHSAIVKVLREYLWEVKDPSLTYKFFQGREYTIQHEQTFWSDAAGTPAALIQPDYEGMTREEWVLAQRKKRTENELN